MSFIRASSERKYSKGGIMYVYGTGDGKIDWMAGNPADSEDLTEIICRVISRAGFELDEEKVDEIRNVLGLDDLDNPVTEQPPTEEEFEEMIEEARRD